VELKVLLVGESPEVVIDLEVPKLEPEQLSLSPCWRSAQLKSQEGRREKRDISVG